jgi:hypothetical protein
VGIEHPLQALCDALFQSVIQRLALVAVNDHEGHVTAAG